MEYKAIIKKRKQLNNQRKKPLAGFSFLRGFAKI